MKKMPTLFKREFTPDHKVIIHNEVTPGCDWGLRGEGIATAKLDGACCAIFDGEFWRRYDAKKGKPIPENAILCQPEADAVTGHLPCWIPVTTASADKWFIDAIQNSNLKLSDNGTYEAVGPHFQNNPYNLEKDYLIKHGSIHLYHCGRTFEAIRDFLERNEQIEGIVFHRENGQMCKIKRTDFGFSWKNSKK
ncbi:MAG: hypothetical protein J5992_02010 [Oscillospiraceae bacterium]|nr:hypothetical protein [Oscillospiraceae bacterium]